MFFIKEENCNLRYEKKGKIMSVELKTNIDRSEEYATKLSKLVAKETISVRGQDDFTKFFEFHRILEANYPNLHKNCEKFEFSGSLLFKWKGKSSDNPILLMSHHDVVEATGEWTHDPFCGKILEYNGDRVVWGRGTVDTKASLSCFMQAVEEMIEEGYTPACDVYLASTCTEEIGGEGAPLIVKYLKENNVFLSMLIDEGGMIMYEPISGAKATFAMVGVLEKGYGDLKFIAKGIGGHASAPPKDTPIVRLSKFICEIEKNNPFVCQFPKTVKETFKRLAPSMKFPMNMIFGNLWFFAPLLKRLMPSINTTGAAMLRTSIAFTMQKGSDGFNVIPQEAYVTANLRFIPHQSTDESIEIVRKIASKYDIDTEVLFAEYPTKEIDINAAPFILLEKTVHEIFPEAIVSPYLMTGGTDARYFDQVCDNCLRFAPLSINAQQYSSIHALNENICIDTLPKAVDFYKKIIIKQESS